jgi:hypothetical protein
MAIKDLTIKFYTQPEEGEKIGFSISDSYADFGKYIFANGENAVDFTYRQPTFRFNNGVLAFNNDLTLLADFNSTSILAGNIAGVIRNDDSIGYVYDADTDGQLTLIVGLFDLYNGYSSVNIAGINSRNGSVSLSLGTTTGGIGINAVRFAPGGGGSFYIGGSQTIWSGTSIKQFAKISGSYAEDSVFNANVAATGLFNSTTVVTKIEVDSLSVSDNYQKIYVGFTNNTGGGRVVRFNTDGTLDATFAEVTCTNSTGAGRVYIRALAMDLDSLFVGGNFEECNGVASRMIARINLSASPSPPGFDIGERMPYLTLVDGSNTRAITIDKDADGTANEIYIATDAFEVEQLSGPNISIKGKGLFRADRDNGYVDTTFVERVGKGISSENYTVGGIYDIKIFNHNMMEPFIGPRKYIMIGGDFRTFGGFRAENIFSFDIDQPADFSDPFGLENGIPLFDKIDFPTDFPNIIYKLIASRKKTGADSTYENLFMAFGRFDATRNMRTSTNFNPTTGTFSNNKNLEIGEYKTNTNSVTFTVDPEYTETTGTISIIIGNLYEESENVYYYDGIVIPFTDTGAPGEVEIGPLVVQNLAAFLTEWMEGPGFNPILPNLLAATRERGLTGPPGIRDFNYNITTTTYSVTLEINNPLWNNWLMTSSTFEDPYIIADTGEAISYASAYADTYWNTWKKLEREYGTTVLEDSSPYYTTDLVEGHYAYDEDFYGSRIHLLFDDGGIPAPPIVPREIYFSEIHQLLGEIEIFSIEQLLDSSLLALTRSPIVLKSIGTQSSTLFDIYSFIGNIEDPAPLSYSISKQKIATTQTALFIDIANIVKEDLEADISGFLSDTPVAPLGENESRWARVRTQNYNGNATASTATTTYHVMDGFVSPFELNAAPECVYTFPKVLTPYLNHIVRGSAPRLYYRNRDVVLINFIAFDGYVGVIEPNLFVSQNDEFYNSIDVATYLGDNNKITFSILYADMSEEIVEYTVYDECRYDTYELIFKNKWGVLETISMSKKTMKALNVSGDEYLRSIVDMNGDYDINRHTKRQFNVNGYEEWTLNTPFIPEYMNESIKQAMLSEEMWIRETGYFAFGELVRTDFAYPVIRMDQSLAYKTELNEQNIQYTIKVRLSHNEIKTIK